MNVKEAIALGQQNAAVMVDLKFIDLVGKWQHTSVPFHRLDEASFEDGFGFDGSSIRGFQPINQSDMLLIPDPETAVMEPVYGTSDLIDSVQYSGHDYTAGLFSRSSIHCTKGRKLFEKYRNRRYVFCWTRS